MKVPVVVGNHTLLSTCAYQYQYHYDCDDDDDDYDMISFTL